MFASEVQFGHAGACANAERETADAKNKVSTFITCRKSNSLYHYSVVFCLGSFRSWSTRTRQFWHPRYPHWVGRHLLPAQIIFSDTTLPLSQECVWAAGGCWAGCSSTREGAPVCADGLLLGPGAWSYPQAILLHVQYLWWEGRGVTVRWHAYLRCIQGNHMHCVIVKLKLKSSIVRCLYG